MRLGDLTTSQWLACSLPINIILTCIDQTPLTAGCLFTEYKHCKRISQQVPLMIQLIRTNPRCRVSPPMHIPCSALLTPQPLIITCPVKKQKPVHVTVDDDHDNHNDDHQFYTQARTISRWKCLQCWLPAPGASTSARLPTGSAMPRQPPPLQVTIIMIMMMMTQNNK